MATKCPDCGDGTFGRFTVDGVVHMDPVCAHAAATGAISTDGLSPCKRCGAVGDWANGYCDRCQWWR